MNGYDQFWRGFFIVVWVSELWSGLIITPGSIGGYAKARGLAKYAQKHHSSFGRIELIRVDGGKINRIDLDDDDTRKKVLTVDTNAGLDLIFDVVN